MSDQIGALDTAFFGNGVDHYNQESGCYTLSLAEQIGRGAALIAALSCEDARAPVRRTVEQLEALLAAAVAVELAKHGPKTPAITGQVRQPAYHFPMKARLEADPIAADIKVAPSYFYQELVTYRLPSDPEAAFERQGRALASMFTKAGWVVELKTAHKTIERIPAGRVRSAANAHELPIPAPQSSAPLDAASSHTEAGGSTPAGVATELAELVGPSPELQQSDTDAEAAPSVEKVEKEPNRTPIAKGSRVSYQVSSCRGLMGPREGKVVGFKKTGRGVWVEIKDRETKTLRLARAGMVHVLGVQQDSEAMLASDAL